MPDLTISDVRAKYPQYSDMSDQQLADALHGKYYSDMDKGQFYTKIGLITEDAPQTPQAQAPQGFLDRAIAAASQRINKMGQERTTLTNVGQAAGMVNDFIGEGINAVLPEQVKAGIASVMNTSPVKAITDTYGKFSQNYPQTALNLESAANIAGLIPAGRGAELAGSAGKSIVKEGVNVASDVLRQTTDKILDQELKTIVRNGMSVGVRPTTKGKGTAPQVAQYYDKATDGVKSIIENKQNLKIVNERGEILSKLPETLDEYSQAVDQTKKAIFNQYDSMQAQAGRRGATPDLNDLVKDLEGIANDKIILDKDKTVAKYAKEKADVFKGRMANGGYTTAEAQDLIKSYNNDLLNFARNPDYALTTKAAIDSRIVKKLRESLDSSIENATGPGYQELKNKYGSLKAIEEDINHRLGVHERRNPMGFFDSLNAFTGYEAIRGLLSGSPEVMASAFGAKAIQEFMKRKNNPNKIVSNMFTKAEENLSRRNRLFKSNTMRGAEDSMSGLIMDQAQYR